MNFSQKLAYTSFKIGLCHREWLIYAKIIFGGLARKMQERQAFCEGAYLESL